MSLLPKNERKVAKETPRSFVIYGGTMHGKTYFADEFPNVLNLNTDGNAEMIETPSINIANQRDAKGKIVKSASQLISDIIVELETTNHSFETLALDVIDDIITLFEQEVTEDAGVRSVADIGYGKGHQMLEMMVRVLVMRLKELAMKKKMNILYLTRLTVTEENGVSKYLPSLKLKWLNIVNGNSDYTILCQKVGKNYIRRVESKRKNYTREKVDDERIALLLDTVIGAYDRSQKTPIAEAKKIVEQQEVATKDGEDAPVNTPEAVVEQPKQEQETPKPRTARPARINPLV
jgi:hypothetical protein